RETVGRANSIEATGGARVPRKEIAAPPYPREICDLGPLPVSLCTRNSGSYLSKRETSRSRPNTIQFKRGPSRQRNRLLVRASARRAGGSGIGRMRCNLLKATGLLDRGQGARISVTANSSDSWPAVLPGRGVPRRAAEREADAARRSDHRAG